MSAAEWSAFRYRDFALACLGKFAVSLATQMQTVAVGWLIYDVTGSAFALGFLGLAGFLPAISLMLVSGLVADRFERRLVLAITAAAMALAAAGLFWHVSTGTHAVWPVYLFIAAFSASRSFFQPASQAILPNLVPLHHFGQAVAFASGVHQAATIAGPAIGGLLYAVDATLPFAFSVFCFAAAAAAMLAVGYRAPAQREAMTWKSVVAGFEFTLKRPVLLGAVTLDMFAVILASAVALLPIFAKDILQVGPWGLGLLRSAPALGALAMAMLLSRTSFMSRRAGPRLFLTVASYGLATIGFGLSEDFFLSLFCLAAIGAADMVSVVIRMTIMQAETPNELRGRVAAVNSLFITTSNEIGQLEAGVLAGFIGAVPAVVLGGIGAIAVAGIWSRLFPDLRYRDHLVGDRHDRARPEP
jgi:MFS family permease